MTLRNLALCPALLALALSASAQHSAPQSAPADTPGATPAPKSPDPAKPKLDPLPADKSVPQTITVNGKTLHYTATVGTITLKSADSNEKPTGEVTSSPMSSTRPRTSPTPAPSPSPSTAVPEPPRST